MDFITLLLIAVGLAMDSFAVSITAGLSLKQFKLNTIIRISVIFAVFQGLMPIIGWLLGQRFIYLIGIYDHWVVFLLLFLIGSKMIYEAWRSEDVFCINIYCNKAIGILAVATSIDALAVGISFSLLEVDIFYCALLIGLVTLFFSFLGLTLGLKLGSLFGRKLEWFGGFLLIVIGIKVLVSHFIA